MSSVSIDKFGVDGKESEMHSVSLRRLANWSPILQYRYLGSFTSDYVSILPSETFAIISTQPSKMQGRRCKKIAKSIHKLYFADSLRDQNYSFLKQQYKQVLPDFQAGVARVPTVASHRLRFQQKICSFSSPISDKKKSLKITMSIHFQL